MANLIDCPSCEREISVNANPCPYCGEPNAGELGVARLRAEIEYENDPVRIAKELEWNRQYSKEQSRKFNMAYSVGLVVGIGFCLLMGMSLLWACGVGVFLGIGIGNFLHAPIDKLFDIFEKAKKAK